MFAELPSLGSYMQSKISSIPQLSIKEIFLIFLPYHHSFLDKDFTYIIVAVSDLGKLPEARSLPILTSLFLIHLTKSPLNIETVTQQTLILNQI